MGKFKTVLLCFLLLALFSGTVCYAKESSKELKKHRIEKTSDEAIHTYGGGELFTNVFNAISMLVYGNTKSGIGKTFNGILRLALTVGGFCCICLAFFREKFEPLIKNFFLPAVGIVSCLLVPRTTVYIQDHLVQKAPVASVASLTKVENVPFFLGKIATLVSTVSYRLTNALEGVAHGVNERTYNWTGHIYAGENIFRTKKCRIANQALEDNFREFCRDCVFRDIGIGLYSKDELGNAPNVLKFLEENTSNIRTVFYRESLDQTPSEGGFLSCKEAIHRMNRSFNGKQDNLREIAFGELGGEMQFLLGQREAGEKDLKNLIKQQIAIDILKEEIPGSFNSFAAKRAEILQRENQKILGALGANSIVAMRNFFESITYIVFPLIIIVSLLSFGLQPLIQWVHFILWVNVWPPFYVVVNFLLNSIWVFRKKLLWGDSLTLTVFTSDGLADLYSSMESIAAIAMAFIPFLSWILLKGGVSQMVHMASSIMSPAQTAASTAAAEKTSGNYSFGNIGIDSVSGHNAQMFKQSYSGMLSHGSVGIDSGSQTLTYTTGQNELYLKQGDSYLREGVSRTQAFSNSLQDSFSSSQSAVLETSKAVSEGITETANRGVGLVDSISKHMQIGENFNTQEMSSAQKAYQYLKGVTDEYAQSRGVSNDQAIKELISGGVGGGFLGVKGEMQFSFQDGVTQNSSDSLSGRSSESQFFQEHLQTIKNLSKGEVASVLGSEDARLHEDFVQSLSKTESSLDQWRAAYTKQESLSELKSFSESENLSVHQNLNQRFVEFLNDKFHGDVGKVVDATELSSLSPSKRALIDEFVQEYLPSKIVGPDMEQTHAAYEGELPNVFKGGFEAKRQDLIQQGEEKVGHSFDDVEKKIGNFKSHLERDEGHAILSLQEKIELMDKTTVGIGGNPSFKGYSQREQEVQESIDRSILGQFADEAVLSKGLKMGKNLAMKAVEMNAKWGAASYLAQYGLNDLETPDFGPEQKKE